MYRRLLTTLLTLFITSLPKLKLLHAKLACVECFLWLTRTRGQQTERKRSRLTLCSPCSGISGVLIRHWDEPPSSSGHVFFFFSFLLLSVVRSKIESPANRRGRPPSDIRQILACLNRMNDLLGGSHKYQPGFGDCMNIHSIFLSKKQAGGDQKAPSVIHEFVEWFWESNCWCKGSFVGPGLLVSGVSAKKQFQEFLLLLPSLHTMAKQTLLAGFSHHIQRCNQETRVDSLWSRGKTPARPSFPLWNDGLPCSSCRRDLCVTQVTSSNISWQIFSLHIYCFSTLCYFLLDRKTPEITRCGWNF